jgi:hypothetical protein
MLEAGSLVEEELKDLMQELGKAINESLSDSDRIAAAIGEIKRAGYDVFLVLEATIGFNKRSEDGEEPTEVAAEPEESVQLESDAPPRKSRRKLGGKISLTSQDQKFLRALKISIDDENQ